MQELSAFWREDAPEGISFKCHDQLVPQQIRPIPESTPVDHHAQLTQLNFFRHALRMLYAPCSGGMRRSPRAGSSLPSTAQTSCQILEHPKAGGGSRVSVYGNTWHQIGGDKLAAGMGQVTAGITWICLRVSLGQRSKFARKLTSCPRSSQR
jgi:hypothetical protein